MDIEFRDEKLLDRPVTINVADNGEPLEYVLCHADDVYQGHTDTYGDVTVTIESDIKTLYHPGDKNELLIMVGYTNREKRQLISDAMIDMLSWPFRCAGFEPGYYMLFLTPEEYWEIDGNYNEDDPVKRPASSMSLIDERYDIPVPTPEFLTVFDHVDIAGRSQTAIHLDVDKAVEEVYNRPNAYRYHTDTLGKYWHELGHDVAGMWHDEDYSTMPNHGDGVDRYSMRAYGCIMCVNQWWFCPRCRRKLRAINPDVHCWQTWQEKEEMEQNHLYWYQEDLLENVGEYAVSQLHQPQKGQVGVVPRP